MKVTLPNEYVPVKFGVQSPWKLITVLFMLLVQLDRDIRGLKNCGMLNLPRPMTHKNVDVISSILGESAKETAEASMNGAVTNLHKGASNDKLADISVSIDGTWQKRGYVSMNGTVSVISMDSGKIVDVETMCRFCKPCQQNKITMTEAEFKRWYENHKSSCSSNYEGSPPMIEVEGAQRMFNRSTANRCVRYMNYFGDGDSKAYASVKDTYKPDIVKKI